MGPVRLFQPFLIFRLIGEMRMQEGWSKIKKKNGISKNKQEKGYRLGRKQSREREKKMTRDGNRVGRAWVKDRKR
jgi:hypothetical protein